jgi:hypothetical protein
MVLTGQCGDLLAFEHSKFKRHRMKSVVRLELSTAAAGPSYARTAAVDNAAPRSNHPAPTYKSAKAVQTTRTTSSGRRNWMFRVIAFWFPT